VVEIYTILSGKYDEAVIPTVNRIWTSNIRGNDVRLQKGRAKHDLWKYSFTNRVVDIWNILPNYVVLCDTINTFSA